MVASASDTCTSPCCRSQQIHQQDGYAMLVRTSRDPGTDSESGTADLGLQMKGACGAVADWAAFAGTKFRRCLSLLSNLTFFSLTFLIMCTFAHLAVVAAEDEDGLGVERCKLLEADQLLAPQRGVKAARRARPLQLNPACHKQKWMRSWFDNKRPHLPARCRSCPLRSSAPAQMLRRMKADWLTS